MNFKTIRQVPIDMLDNATAYMADHPFLVGGAATAGGTLLGGSLMPANSYSEQDILKLNQMDKSLVLDQMARSGKFSNEELLAASALSNDELMNYLAQSNNSYGITGGVLGGVAGLAGGLGLVNASRNRWNTTRAM